MNVLEALSLSGWTHVIQEEMTTLEQNGTWKVTLSPRRNRWNCQVRPKRVSSSLKDKIDYQKILTGIWTELCGYLLPGREDDICAGSCVISSDMPLETLLVGHHKYLSQWYS